jgi:hypothetical protein
LYTSFGIFLVGSKDRAAFPNEKVFGKGICPNEGV